MVTIPKPVVPVGYNFFLVYIPMGIKYDPNSAPNRGFTHEVSGIGYPLTSLPVGEIPNLLPKRNTKSQK
jgi:hypothetical protein